MTETMRTMTGRAVWAERIRAAYGATVEAVFQVGRELLQAKQELPHGEFHQMIERDLPFSIRTAQVFIAIASTPHLQTRNTVACLPITWGTLEVLRRLDASTFEKAVAAGKVFPEMTRAEAEALLPVRAPALVVPMNEATRVKREAAQDKSVLPNGWSLAEYRQYQRDVMKENREAERQGKWEKDLWGVLLWSLRAFEDTTRTALVKAGYNEDREKVVAMLQRLVLLIETNGGVQ